MQRREFITLMGVAAVTPGMLPQLACAQASTKRPLLAVLAGVTRREFPVSFMEGMREFGYVEGDVVYRFADGRLDLLPALAGMAQNHKSRKKPLNVETRQPPRISVERRCPLRKCDAAGNQTLSTRGTDHFRF